MAATGTGSPAIDERPEPQGRVALITGAGGGVGRAIAQVFAERGAKAVALLDISAEALEATAELLADAETEVLIHVVDVSNRAQMEAAFAETVATFGGLHYVCNNAATQTWQPAFPHASLDAVEQVVDVNVRGVVLGAQLGFDHMSVNGGGSIVSTASGAGKVPLPSDALYSATKAAVVMLTKAAAPNFAEGRVRINAVCPGLIDTEMLTRSVEGRADLEAWIDGAPKLSGREVATAIVDLAIDASLTGQTPSVRP